MSETPVRPDRVVVEVVPGGDPLPFIQEYCWFVWLHGNPDSDGDAKWPLDRAWAWLHHSDRAGSERFDVLGPGETGRDDGIIVIEATDRETALRAAYLTAWRTGGSVRDSGETRPLAELALVIPRIDERLRLADEIREACFDRVEKARPRASIWATEPVDFTVEVRGVCRDERSCATVERRVRQVIEAVDAHHDVDADDPRWRRWLPAWFVIATPRRSLEEVLADERVWDFASWIDATTKNRSWALADIAIVEGEVRLWITPFGHPYGADNLRYLLEVAGASEVRPPDV